jgi:hypothetical protein
MRLAHSVSGFLLVATLSIGVSAVVAQELQLDPKALDTSGASSVQFKRGKGKRGAEAAPRQAPGKPGAAGPNRQFGELEGWSPGKAPPKPKDKYDADPNSASSSSAQSGKAPVSVTPTGNMAVGLPF